MRHLFAMGDGEIQIAVASLIVGDRDRLLVTWQRTGVVARFLREDANRLRNYVNEKPTTPR